MKSKTYYKAFDRNLQCRGFQYKEGEIYEIDGPLVLCERGFHFCKELVLTLGYYPVKNCITENKYAEVEVLGDVKWEDVIAHKGVTNKIRIARVLPDDEVLSMIDDKNNSGNRNSGNRNSGNWNSGNWNSGDWNSGNQNSGDWNSGNRNSGYWNSGNRNSGYFNIDTPATIRVFGHDCDMSEWDNAYKPGFLFFDLDPEIGYKASLQKSWNEADPDERDRVRELPNFDAQIFFEISGIDLRGER